MGSGPQALGPAATLLLIRHAVTPLNEQNRIQAWDDVDINLVRGQEDTLKTAQYLQGAPIFEIVTSDLARAEQTGEVLANQMFVPISSDRNLRPWDLGKLAAMRFADIQADVDYYIEHSSKQIPGGERFNDFIERWHEGLQGLVARAMQSPTGAIAAVTHSRNIEATRYLLSGSKDSKSMAKANSVPPSGVMALRIQDGRLREIPFRNDHLSKEDE